MKKRTKSFKVAIEKSLEDLIVRGEKITQSAVIKNAKFDDGKSVGKTTIYKKNGVGEYIHKDLLLKISQAIEKKKKKIGKKTKSESLIALKLENKNLKKEVSSLVDQLVELQSVLRQVRSSVNSDINKANDLELEIYILSSLIKEFTSRQSIIAKKSTEYIFKFEQKYSASEIIEDAKNKINIYINDAKVAAPLSLLDD